jgi:hypothetical protein
LNDVHTGHEQSAFEDAVQPLDSGGPAVSR